MRMLAHHFHDEIGPARLGGPGVEHLGDMGMVHQGQRLPFRLEARHDLAGVHALFDDLGHLARKGLTCSAR